MLCLFVGLGATAIFLGIFGIISYYIAKLGSEKRPQIFKLSDKYDSVWIHIAAGLIYLINLTGGLMCLYIIFLLIHELGCKLIQHV